MKNKACQKAGTLNLKWLKVSACLLLFFAISCAPKPEPYAITEFEGSQNVTDYSRTLMLYSNRGDTMLRTAVLGGKNDLYALDDFYLRLGDSLWKQTVTIRNDDSVLFINGKLNAIRIPSNEMMISWLSDKTEEDFSTLGSISLNSQWNDAYWPYLEKMASVSKGAGLVCEGDLSKMEKLFKIFSPTLLAGPVLSPGDNAILSQLADVSILVLTPLDSVSHVPLPPLPRLEQLYLVNWDEDYNLPENFLENNPQLEILGMLKSGTPDLALVSYVPKLRELVMVTDAEKLEGWEKLNNLKYLELLSLTGDKLVYSPDSLSLPSLRWMTFGTNVTQPEFDAFIASHPDLEVVEVVKNDTVSKLASLANLKKLYGLTISDTLVDIPLVKTLKNLTYLSLPEGYMESSQNREEIGMALPDTRIVTNEGLCLGSGWLLLLIPLCLVFFLVRKRINLVKNR